MNRYVYSYEYDNRTGRLEIDCFYKVKAPPLTVDALKIALRINPHLLDEDVNAINSISLRCKFQNCIGPKFIRTDFELTREDLRTYLENTNATTV